MCFIGYSFEGSDMVDILHKVGIKASTPGAVYNALTTLDGLAGWWTVHFDIAQEGDWTLVRFKHQGWKEPVDFMHHCSTKWGVFLLSLKSLLETGQGAPAPNEIKLDSWE